MMRTCFVYRREGLDTAEIRGRQIAAALGCDTCRLRELTVERAAAYDALVYVKFLPPPALLERIRARGVRQIADPLDNYGWRALARRAPFLDAFIAANLTHAAYLERRFGRPAVAIPHHHCNVEERRIPPGREPPTLGYIAGVKPWPANRRLVRRLARRLGCPVVANVRRRGLVGLADAYLAVDIGFAWRADRGKLRFNCANKLTNYMSFGIPAVLTPETGYLEVARHGECCFYAHTREDFLLFLERLVADPELRRRMGDAGYEAARPYHIRRIAERYRSFLGEW